MATPLDAVIEQLDALLGYEAGTAIDFADAIHDIGTAAVKLQRIARNLAQQATENPGMNSGTTSDLDDLAKACEAAYDASQAAHGNFWDTHKFWLAGRDDDA